MFLQSLFRRCVNFIFPPRCIFCKKVLVLTADVRVCTDCMEHLPFCLSFHHCQRCGRPIPEGETYCYRCGKGLQNHYRKILAAYLYEDDPKRALLRFKRERYESYAAVFAAHMAAVLQNSLPRHDFDWVVAVPPRKRRIQKDGYDQAEALGLALAKQLGLPFLRGALRQKEIRRKQSTLTYRERWQNVLGNYAVVKKNAVAEKRILLVDDICTTGATLNECAKTLKAAGAMEVVCSVAAISHEEKILQF